MSMNDQEVFCDLVGDDFTKLDRRWIKKHVLFSSTFDQVLGVIGGQEVPVAAIRTKWSKQRRGPLRGLSACVCVALRGSLLHRTGCRIYARRPRACRVAIKPGDKACLGVRRLLLDLAERESQ